MAKLGGMIKLRGALGAFIFSKTQDGYTVRARTGLDAERIANDPAFQRTRENATEFGHAAKSGKVLKTAVQSLLMNSADTRLMGRLTRAMMRVLQEDPNNKRGSRTVVNSGLKLLHGFDFNIRGRLSGTLYAPIVAQRDRAAGILTIDIAPFVPADLLLAPEGITHFKILSAGAEIDFINERSVVACSETGFLPWDTTPTAAIHHVNAVTAHTDHPLFSVVGIQFYQEQNGVMYRMKNATFNPLAIVLVDTAV